MKNSAIFKNTALLNDCKPTKEFLNMEQTKDGYCNLSKLRVEKIDVSTGQKVDKEIIEPHYIRDEMKNFYQNIFNTQTIKDGDKGTEDFLNFTGIPILMRNLSKNNYQMKPGIH